MWRLGSIGAGRRGRLCKLAHCPDRGTELVAICDPRPDIHSEYRQTVRPDIQVYTDYRRLLDEAKVDAVFITTPDFLHEEMAVAALQRGIGVYLEKPMAITVEGCDRILRTAQEHQAKLFVGHNMRFFPVVEKMKQIIDSGRIGQVQAIWCRHFINYGGDAYFKDWHSERQYTTSLLLQKGAHDIDVIHHLAGAHTLQTVGMGKLSVYNQIHDRRRADQRIQEAKSEVSHWPPLAQTQLSPVIDVEDHSMILMHLANGIQASYEQCHYTPDSVRNYTVIGTEGRMENFGDYSSGEHEASIRLWTRRVMGYLEHGTESVSIPPLEGSHGGSDPRIVQAFLDYLKTGRHDGATPMDARQAVAVGYWATQSIRHGSKPYEINPYVFDRNISLTSTNAH